MSLMSNGRLRVLFAIACISFLFLYHYRTQELEIVAQGISADLLKCQEQTDSVIARLQLMYDHKELASDLLNRERREILLKKEEFETRVRRCELESARVKKDLNNCQADPAGFNAPPTLAPSLKQAEMLLLKEKEVLQLKENLEQLQHILEEKRLEIEKLQNEKQTLQITTENCLNKLSLQAAVSRKIRK
ncbi:unnamed protein product, partial [Mesorhabditis belari]|uniref:Uncharacterized protein n=1 Tax=Mesorhabditis belari TaxID=2138241 RepID=A0AAF3EYF4_9BILA